MCHREPSLNGGQKSAYTYTGSGPYNAERPCAPASHAMPKTHCTGLAHYAHVRRSPKRVTRRPLGNHTYRAMSRRRRQCQLCVSLPLRTRNKDDDGLTLKCGWMGANCLIRFVKQTCSTPVRVPPTTTTGRRCTRTLGGAQTSLFRCLERLVGCTFECTGGTVSFFFFCLGFVTDGCLLACRQRHTKFPAMHQHMELKVHSRSLEVRSFSTLKINTCKL